MASKSQSTTTFASLTMLSNEDLAFIRFLPTACDLEHGTLQVVILDTKSPDNLEVISELREVSFAPTVINRMDISPTEEQLVWVYESLNYETVNVMLTDLNSTTTTKLLETSLEYDGEFVFEGLISHIFWVASET